MRLYYGVVHQLRHTSRSWGGGDTQRVITVWQGGELVRCDITHCEYENSQVGIVCKDRPKQVFLRPKPNLDKVLRNLGKV